MTDLPDLRNTSPDEWLSRLDELRSELVAEVSSILDDNESSDAAAAALREVFAEVQVDSESEGPLIDVDLDSGNLVFDRDGADHRVIVARSESDEAWQLNSGDLQTDPTTSADRREALAREILSLLPWWKRGAFADRVGQPDDFQ